VTLYCDITEVFKRKVAPPLLLLCCDYIHPGKS
jgi:hypothetical protein